MSDICGVITLRPACQQRAPGLADGRLLCAPLAYYVAFGPHGPRRPINPPGTTLKVTLGAVAGIAAAGVLFATAKSFCELFPFPPRRVRVCSCRPSTATAQDHQQGVGRGRKRACVGTENEPHLWFVPFLPLPFVSCSHPAYRYRFRGIHRQGLCYAQVAATPAALTWREAHPSLIRACAFIRDDMLSTPWSNRVPALLNVSADNNQYFYAA